MDYRGWKVRRNLGIKALIVLALLTWTTREGIQVYYSITDPYPQKTDTSEQKREISQTIPSEAIEVGRLFVTHWYYLGKKESKEDKVERLQPFMSQTVSATVQFEGVLSMNEMTLNDVQQLGVPEWSDPGLKARIPFRVNFADGRKFWVSVDVSKAGERWVVDNIPALIPEPNIKNEKPKTVKLDPEEIREITGMLDGFFPMWLTGKEESYKRFASKKLPTDNSLEAVIGSYKSVRVSPVSENPLQIRALVHVTNSKESHYFEYLVSFEKKDGELRISNIQ